MSSALRGNEIILNDVTYTKEDLSKSDPVLYLQSIIIADNLNLIHYPLAFYDKSINYKVYVGGIGDLDLINNPEYDVKIENGELIINSYDSSISNTFLVIGTC